MFWKTTELTPAREIIGLYPFFIKERAGFWNRRARCGQTAVVYFAFFAGFFAATFFAGAFLAGAFFAVAAFLQQAFLQQAFLAGAFLTATFFAGAFLAATFLVAILFDPFLSQSCRHVLFERNIRNF